MKWLFLFLIFNIHGSAVQAFDDVENLFPIEVDNSAIEFKADLKTFYKKVRKFQKEATQSCFATRGLASVSSTGRVYSASYLESKVDHSYCEVSKSFVNAKIDLKNFSPNCSIPIGAAKDLSPKVNKLVLRCLRTYETQIERETEKIKAKALKWATANGGLSEEN